MLLSGRAGKLWRFLGTMAAVVSVRTHGEEVITAWWVEGGPRHQPLCDSQGLADDGDIQVVTAAPQEYVCTRIRSQSLDETPAGNGHSSASGANDAAAMMVARLRRVGATWRLELADGVVFDLVEQSTPKSESTPPLSELPPTRSILVSVAVAGSQSSAMEAVDSLRTLGTTALTLGHARVDHAVPSGTDASTVHVFGTSLDLPPATPTVGDQVCRGDHILALDFPTSYVHRVADAREWWHPKPTTNSDAATVVRTVFLVAHRLDQQGERFDMPPLPATLWCLILSMLRVRDMTPGIGLFDGLSPQWCSPPADWFVRYIYEEYWQDDLKLDRFVPTPCIQAHFTEDVVWRYGGDATTVTQSSFNSCKHPLIGTYHGSDGMAEFLGNFGAVFKVEEWFPRAIVWPSPLTPQVGLAATYVVRDTGQVLSIDERHSLTLTLDDDGELRIASVDITFDEHALHRVVGWGANITVCQHYATGSH